jgi:hypothetical protein
VKLLSFTTQYGLPGLIDELADINHCNDIDDRDLKIDLDGNFEVIFSVERPAGYAGNWAPISPKANLMMVRYRSYDWGKEQDPQLSIECLDKVPPKSRLTPEEIDTRIRLMAKMPVRATKLFLKMQNDVKNSVGINVFEPVRYRGGLTKQVYLPAVFEFEDDEALIIETDLPKARAYWNFQLNDPYFNAIEYVYRLSCTNGAMAKISSDGKFRGVIALTDPGVPNWLDPAGFKQGTIYGRWFDCDSHPTPVIKRVKLASLRYHLPKDTPVVTAEERSAELQARIRAAQRRRRW